MKYRKMNRLERKADRQAKLAENLKGEGLYLYENNTRSDIQLPKPALSGLKWIGPGQRFQGDSYFKNLVGNGLRIIKEIISPQQENIMTEQKLILDQPDRVTSEGTTEHVVKQPKVPLNENRPQKPAEPKLITEDPLDGVEILLG